MVCCSGRDWQGCANWWQRCFWSRIDHAPCGRWPENARPAKQANTNTGHGARRDGDWKCDGWGYSNLSGERNVRSVASRGTATKKLNVGVSGFSSGVMFNFVRKRLGDGRHVDFLWLGINYRGCYVCMKCWFPMIRELVVGIIVIWYGRCGIAGFVRRLVNLTAHAASILQAACVTVLLWCMQWLFCCTPKFYALAFACMRIWGHSLKYW